MTGAVTSESAARPRNSSRKRLFAVMGFTLSMLILLLFGEVVARLMGYRPFHAVPGNVTVEPGGKLYRPLSEGGYVHYGGEFTVTLPTGYQFHLSHDADGLRSTRRGDAIATNQPGLWIMGCSITHGWSVNDGESYPWLVQSALTNHAVLNGGVSGYGTLHSRLLFQELLKKKSKPKTVVYAYGLFHDHRNTFVRIWQKGLVPYNKLPLLTYPRARWNGTVELNYDVVPVAYNEWLLQRQSALVHFAEQQYNIREAGRERIQEVSRELVKNWAAFCLREGIEFIVAGISSDATPLLDWCRTAGISAVDISVPLSEPGNTNAPHDGHPSAKAHRVYAVKLIEFLNSRRHLADALIVPSLIRARAVDANPGRE